MSNEDLLGDAMGGGEGGADVGEIDHYADDPYVKSQRPDGDLGTLEPSERVEHGGPDGRVSSVADVTFIDLFEEFELDRPQSSTQIILMLEASDQTGFAAAPSDAIAVAVREGGLTETTRGEFVPGEWA